MNKEELNLLEIVFTLAIGECAYNDIHNIQKLEEKIKTVDNFCRKQKEEYNKIQKAYESTFSDYQELKGNWNKLRELILEEGFEINTREYGSIDVIDKNVILEKMQELERAEQK